MKKNTNQKSKEKLEGLRVLIDHSFLINSEEKQTLIASMITMKPSDIDALGQFLAWEKQSSLAASEEVLHLGTSLRENLPQVQKASL